jgi:hypothetical protein
MRVQGDAPGRGVDEDAVGGLLAVESLDLDDLGKPGLQVGEGQLQERQQEGMGLGLGGPGDQRFQAAGTRRPPSPDERDSQQRGQVGADRLAMPERPEIVRDRPGDASAACGRGAQRQRIQETWDGPEGPEAPGRLCGQPDVVILCGAAHPMRGRGVFFQAGPLGADSGEHGAVDEPALVVVRRPEFQGPGGPLLRPGRLVVGAHHQPAAGEAQLQGVAARGGLPPVGPGAGRPLRIQAVRVDARLRGGHRLGNPGCPLGGGGEPATSPGAFVIERASPPFEYHRSVSRVSPLFLGNLGKSRPWIVERVGPEPAVSGMNGRFHGEMGPIRAALADRCSKRQRPRPRGRGRCQKSTSTDRRGRRRATSGLVD